MESFVTSEIDALGICTITFFHPKSNSLPFELLENLAYSIEHASTNEDAKVLIVKSEGERAFCAGASFDELLQIENVAQGIQFFSGFAQVINAIRKCPKMVIGVVQGKAVGGGVGLAATVDICFAAPTASVKLSELNIGIGPFVIEPAVTRKIGVSAFAEMTLQPEVFFDADWAKSKGLFQVIASDFADLQKLVYQKAMQFAQMNPEALKELKRVLWQGTDHWEQLLLQRAALSGKLVLSEYTKNALVSLR